MTFNEMRFSDVWITLAFCAILCIYEVRCGPVSPRKDIEVIEEHEPTPEASAEDTEGQKLNFPAAPDQSEDDDGDDNYEAVVIRRSVREVSQKPVTEDVPETDEESVIPNGSAPLVPEKKPSVLELLSTALDKAIEVTSKIPTQQVASDAAGVFQILGQVFSEAIDKVIGVDDGPDDSPDESPEDVPKVTTEVLPSLSDNSKEPELATQQPVHEAPPMMIVEQQQQQQQGESSQSDKDIVNTL